MKTFFSRESKEVAQQVREALQNGEKVEWNTEYETFYGAGWSDWAISQVKDLNCKIECRDLDNMFEYWRTIVITPNK